MVTNKPASECGDSVYENWEKCDVKRWILLVGLCGTFLFGIGCIYISSRSSQNSEIGIRFDSTKADKLMHPIPIPLTPEDDKEEFPRPFGIEFRDPVPSLFKVSSTTEKITTISYPQLAKYRNNNYYQPRNIQDILRYTLPLMKAKSYIENGHQTQHVPNYGPTSNHDPFYAYKPQDPSDVNLMATGSVRFAPPPWKNMNKSPYTKTMNNLNIENPYNMHIRDKFGRPMVVTLNIFPMTERDRMMMGLHHHPGHVSLLGKMIASSEYEGRIGNMLLKLNVFPEALSSLNIEKQGTRQ